MLDTLARKDIVGHNVYEVFSTLQDENGDAFYRRPIEDILNGMSIDETTETQIKSNGMSNHPILIAILYEKMSPASNAVACCMGYLNTPHLP